MKIEAVKSKEFNDGTGGWRAECEKCEWKGKVFYFAPEAATKARDEGLVHEMTAHTVN